MFELFEKMEEVQAHSARLIDDVDFARARLAEYAEKSASASATIEDAALHEFWLDIVRRLERGGRYPDPGGGAIPAAEIE